MANVNQKVNFIQEINCPEQIKTEYPSNHNIWNLVSNTRKEIEAVLDNRRLMGATDPKNAEDGTIRKEFGLSIDKNSVHGSDSIDNAKVEINFFFNN